MTGPALVAVLTVVAVLAGAGVVLLLLRLAGIHDERIARLERWIARRDIEAGRVDD